MILISLFPLLFSGIIQAKPQSKHFTVEEIDQGIWAVIHKFGGYAICNAGSIDLGDETLIFDLFISPEAARDLKRVAEELTAKPIKYVINNYYPIYPCISP